MIVECKKGIWSAGENGLFVYGETKEEALEKWERFKEHNRRWELYWVDDADRDAAFQTDLDELNYFVENIDE